MAGLKSTKPDLDTGVSDGLGDGGQSCVVGGGASEPVGDVAHGQSRIQVSPSDGRAGAAVAKGLQRISRGFPHTLVSQC